MQSIPIRMYHPDVMTLTMLSRVMYVYDIREIICMRYLGFLRGTYSIYFTVRHTNLHAWHPPGSMTVAG